MELWHFLSKQRLWDKINYASVNGGKLLLHPPELSKDITRGVIREYIYCLPSIISGMNFGDSSDLAVIRIFLKEGVRVFSFRGNPRDLDYEQMSANFDVIDMIVDARDFSEVRFRQILLLNNESVESWESSEEIDFSHHFGMAFENLTRGNFHLDDFFMIDFDHEEVSAAVRLMGHSFHSLGIKGISEEEFIFYSHKIQVALRRLHATD